MKRIQIGFAAIIAVMAMSFTIAEHNGIFEDRSTKNTTDCFKAGGTNGLKIKHSCSGPIITITTTSPCNITVPGDKVWSLDTDNVIAVEDAAVECPGGGTFCCFQVAEDPNPCTNPAQPTLNIGAGAKAYKVSAVYCKAP